MFSIEYLVCKSRPSLARSVILVSEVGLMARIWLQKGTNFKVCNPLDCDLNLLSQLFGKLICI